ncbi:MAG: GFA family protein [Proteobacteria bacterium]|nr:GFA family protein [Pseudomonadota bacterium]
MDGIALTGGCACGAVRYRLAREPMFTHCCHCTQCQQLSGSAFAINIIIENDSIEVLSGDIITTDGPSESGRPHIIHRCASCQTAVWSDYGGRPNYRFVRVGTLDRPHAIKPDAHIFVRSKVPWVIIPPDQKAFDIFYVLEEEWPADKLERRRRAIGG